MFLTMFKVLLNRGNDSLLVLRKHTAFVTRERHNTNKHDTNKTKQ